MLGEITIVVTGVLVGVTPSVSCTVMERFVVTGAPKVLLNAMARNASA